MKSSILSYKNAINIDFIKKIQHIKNNTELNDLISNNKIYTSVCINLIYGELKGTNDEILVEVLLKNIEKYYDDMAMLSLYYIILEKNIINNFIEEKYKKLIENIYNYSKKELYSFFPLLFKINSITKKDTEVICKVIEKIDFLSLFKNKDFFKDLVDEFEIYLQIPINKKYFKNPNTYNLFKILKKLTSGPLTNDDINTIKNMNLSVKNFYCLNYYSIIKLGKKSISHSNAVVVNYILSNILDEDDLDLDALITIDRFSDKYPKYFEKIYKHLSLVSNEKTFKLLINNDYFSIYLLDDYINLLRNNNSKLLSSKIISYCINQIVKNDFETIEDIEFFIEYIKKNNIKTNFNNILFNNLLKYEKIDFSNINSIKSLGLLFNGKDYYEEVVYYYFKNHSLKDFLNFKDFFSMEDFKKISEVSIKEICDNKELYNKEFLEFYLKVVFCFKPNEYPFILSKILLNYHFVEILKYTNEELVFLIEKFKENKLLPLNILNQLSRLYCKTIDIANVEQLENLIKNNLYSINWDEIIKEYLNNISLNNSNSLMSIYFLLKKYKRLNQENLIFIENKIYKLKRFS